MPVYLIRAGDSGPVKIGWAKDAEARRKQLQVSHHQPLQVIRIIEGRRETEGWLHERFTEQRLKGEWFRFHADMAAIEPPEFGPPTPKQPKQLRMPRNHKSPFSWNMCWSGNLCQECRTDPAEGWAEAALQLGVLQRTSPKPYPAARR